VARVLVVLIRREDYFGVAADGQVVIWSMMYLVLTYKHRIIDGREAVTFLVQVKEFIENPELGLVGQTLGRIGLARIF